MPSSGSITQRGLPGSPSISPAFLEQEAPVGPRGAQLVVERPLGRLVGLGDEVGRPLAADLEVLDLAEVAAQPLPALRAALSITRIRPESAIFPLLERIRLASAAEA